MNQKVKLTATQKEAIRDIRKDIYSFSEKAKNLNDRWKELEDTNSPIGFMDTMYPFQNRFDELVKDIEIWAKDVKDKTLFVFTKGL